MTEWISDKWCLYKHTSPSGKVYVGITNNTKNRWRTGGIGYKSQTVFWKAITKYGWDNFQHEILETGLTVEEAKQKEIELIKELKSNKSKHGYNMTDGGDIIPNGMHSQESIEKAKATRKAKLEAGIHCWNYGVKYPDWWRKKLSDAHKGLPSGRKGAKLTNEQRQHLREVNTGKRYSEENKIKISQHSKGKQRGERHAMYGKHHSKETKSKISESLRSNGGYTTRTLTILQCSLSGEVIKSWPSLTSIVNELHLDKKGKHI